MQEGEVTANGLYSKGCWMRYRKRAGKLGAYDGKGKVPGGIPTAQLRRARGNRHGPEKRRVGGAFSVGNPHNWCAAPGGEGRVAKETSACHAGTVKAA